MANKLCIIACENHKDEVDAVIKSEGLDDVMVLAFPAHCGHPQMGWNDLWEIIHPFEKEYSRIYLIGGCCITGIEEAPEAPDSLRFHKMDQCFHLFTNKNIVDSYLKKGSYLLSPGWVKHWQRHVDEWGFDREAAQAFFKESINRLVFLDTGIYVNSSDHLQEFANFVNLPFEIVPVGLDFFRLFLMKLILEWRVEEEKNKPDANLSKANRQLADHFMVAALIADMTKVMTEKKAVENIIELFIMLCAPARLVYVSFIDGRPEHVQSVPAAHVDEKTIKNRLAVFSEDYAWTESGSGFLVRIGHEGETLGFIEIDGLTFPEYKEHYLNLSLTIGQVCGLAITNARKYEKIKKAEDEIRASHSRLSSILDGLDAIVYMADIETYNVIYMNQYAQGIFGDVYGKPCWKVFKFGQSGPCDFCTMKQLITTSGRPTGVYAWEFQNEANGRWYAVRDRALRWTDGRLVRLSVMIDVTEHKLAEEEKERLIKELEDALDQVKQLSGMLPICASCKKIRDDSGYWNQIESYIRDHSEAEFSHGICPECAKKLYPDLKIFKDE